MDGDLLMSYKVSKYSKDFSNELAGRVAVVLFDATEPITINDIKNRDMVLSNITSQKITRILSNLIDTGFVVKGKNKTGHMTYVCTDNVKR